jgi:hypothetical protein
LAAVFAILSHPEATLPIRRRAEALQDRLAAELTSQQMEAARAQAACAREAGLPCLQGVTQSKAQAAR